MAKIVCSRCQGKEPLQLRVGGVQAFLCAACVGAWYDRRDQVVQEAWGKFLQASGQGAHDGGRPVTASQRGKGKDVR